jgi:hypothetical protein
LLYSTSPHESIATKQSEAPLPSAVATMPVVCGCFAVLRHGFDEVLKHR